MRCRYVFGIVNNNVFIRPPHALPYGKRFYHEEASSTCEQSYLQIAEQSDKKVFLAYARFAFRIIFHHNSSVSLSNLQLISGAKWGHMAHKALKQYLSPMAKVTGDYLHSAFSLFGGEA